MVTRERFHRFVKTVITPLVLLGLVSLRSVKEPSSRHSPRASNLSNIAYVINNDICLENSSPILAIMMVTSHIGNVDERNAIREAYPSAELQILGIRRAFLLGTLNHRMEPNPEFSSISHADIQRENEIFSDIIQVHVSEDHNNLTVRNLMGLKWISAYCHEARLVIKVNDDVIYDVYQMKQVLESIGEEDKDNILGYLKVKSSPSRDPSNKWYISTEEYPHHTYPDYVAGFLYVTTPKTVNILVETSNLVPHFRIDDVFITGMMAEKAGVERLNLDKGLSISGSLNCCRTTNRSVMYECANFASSRIDIDFDQKLLFDIRLQASYCYYSKNCRKVCDIIDMSQLICF